MTNLNQLSPARKSELTEYLKQFVSEHKLALFDRIIMSRTRYITVVLEDIFQSHNASAVLRSCDCFGLQDVHIIERKYNFMVTKEIALGSSKWLTINKYDDPDQTLESSLPKLKEKGYRLVAMMPDEKCIDIQELDLNPGPIALLFGTELRGLSKNAIKQADEFVKIPMFGFTESLNISVSAATSLFYLTDKLRKSEIPWHLTELDEIDVRFSWLLNAINHSSEIVNLFFERNPDFLNEIL